MHDTALIAGELFGFTYGATDKVVVDIGGKNVNGSLREFFEKLGMKYICLDIEEDASVDIVIKPGDKLPFETGSIDLIVTSSCFEHDPCFWITFREMTRVIKFGGYIYVNAPTNGPYHCYPGDNWRFYSDAGQALAYWSGYQFGTEEVFPVKVVETFHLLPAKDIWTDFICVWQRCEEKTSDICVSNDLLQTIGPLEKSLQRHRYRTTKKC